MKQLTFMLASALLVVTACNEPSRTPAPAPSEVETPEVQPLAVSPWPTGYVVVSDDEWVPVVDDLGRDLHAARDAFAEGHRPEARDALQHAATVLNDEKERAPEEQREGLDRAARAIATLATRVGGDSPPTLAELDRTLADSYRADVRRPFVHIHEDAVREFVVGPSPDLGRAEEAFERGDMHAAAREIRQAAAWFGLVADEAQSDLDRGDLREQVRRLYTLARRTDEGEVTDVAELRRDFAGVNTTYATYYMHLAERATESQTWPDVGRALHAAVQRMEQGVRWAREEAHDLDASVAEDVRAIATTLANGGAVAVENVRQAIERVRAELAKLSPVGSEHAAL